MVKTTNLIKNYGNICALNIPDLKLSKGDSLGIVGNNGAGKTTFLRLLLDLIQPSQGYILIDDKRVDKYEDWKQFTGSYLDEHFLVPFTTPEEYFGFVGSSYGLSAEVISERIQSLEDLFTEAVPGTNRYIRDLSLGNRKKTGIIAALLIHPKLLVLDEPFSNLDPTSQYRLKKHLLSLQKNEKITTIISSHDLTHIVDVSNRLVVLDEGKIVDDMTNNEQALTRLENYFARE